MRLFLGILIIGLLGNCSNEIDLAIDDFEPSPVIYGLLKAQDSVHYIRVQKTFLEEGVSAFELAQDTNRLYYAPEEINVRIIEWNGDQELQTYVLQRVAGDSLGLPGQDGTFASSPNVLYRFFAELNDDYDYELQVDLPGGKNVNARISMVRDFLVYIPESDGFPLNFVDTGLMNLQWLSARNALIYDAQFKVYYTEENIFTGDTTNHTLNWTIFKNKIHQDDRGIDVLSHRQKYRSFYSFIQSKLDPKPGYRRYLRGMDFELQAGGEPIYLLYLNTLVSFGILEFYISPAYTNLSDGFGIFSSAYSKQILKVNVTDISIDSLACGSITGDLGFVSSPSSIFYPGCN